MPATNVGPIIGPTIGIAARSHRVDIWNPMGAPVPDDGEYIQDYAAVGHVYAAIEPATAQRMERLTRAGSMASATHIVTMPYTKLLTARSRLLFGSRRLDVVGLADPRELGAESVAVCQEIVT